MSGSSSTRCATWPGRPGSCSPRTPGSTSSSSRSCPPSSSATSRPSVTDPAEIDRANLYARKALFASGDAIVAGTKVGGRHYLKFTLLNPETTVDDIVAVLDLIAYHAEQYLGENLVEAS